QPGQVIHVRALALRQPDLKPVANHAMEFSITDPKGNVIFKEAKPSSAFGIGSIDCPLAEEILEGNYALSCRLGDTESKLTVQVKRYALPKFRIGVELDQPYYQPGQTVRGKLHVEYFFGKPVTGAAAEIEISNPSLPQSAVQKLTARTNAKGDADFGFVLP